MAESIMDGMNESEYKLNMFRPLSLPMIMSVLRVSTNQ